MFLSDPVEFQWDKGNTDKNLYKHNLTTEQIEGAFLDVNRKIYKDVLHSASENRYILLGQEISGTLLYVVFTLRKQKVRVISARSLNKKEVHLYYEKSA